MHDVVTIAPVGEEPGLIAYECPRCRHVDSDLIFPQSAHPVSDS
jgi:hypothetical protein